MSNNRRFRCKSVLSVDPLESRHLLSTVSGSSLAPAPNSPPAAVAPASGVTGLHIVNTPIVNGSMLNATSAVAANDVWAVGSQMLAGSTTAQPLIEHFNGTSWSVVPSPTLPNGGSLRAVSALSANNVWAVGTGSGLAGTAGGLIEHFDGTKWSVVSSASSVSGVLNGVTAISANDVWAVGQGTNSTDGSTFGNLIEHFDGTRWTAVPAPAFSFNRDNLFSVSADGANDVWAVGITGRSVTARTEVLHFDGTTWSAAPAPANMFAHSIAAVSPTDVWAVGTSSNGVAQIQHFNGTSWSVVPSPGPANSALTAVTAVSPNDVWAVGTVSGATTQTLVEHWDGTSWNVVPSANPPSGTNSNLSGVAAVSGGTGPDAVVVVGTSIDSNGHTQGLILQS